MKPIDFVRDQSPIDCLNQADLDQVAQALIEVHFTRNSQILVRDGSPARSTLARLQAAGQAKVLTQDEVELLGEAYHFILYLRLREQLHAYHTGGPLNSWVRLKTLSAIERRHLKEAFLAIRQIQGMTATRFHTDRIS